MVCLDTFTNKKKWLKFTNQSNLFKHMKDILWAPSIRRKRKDKKRKKYEREKNEIPLGDRVQLKNGHSWANMAVK